MADVPMYRKWSGNDLARLGNASDDILGLLARNDVLTAQGTPMFQYPDTLTLLAAQQIILREFQAKTVV
jgi:hypothetical protein